MDLPSRRLHLKNATDAAHRSLDSMIGDFDGVESYHRYLQGMARFRLPVDAWLSARPMPQELNDWRPAIYDDALRADLDDLGLRHPDSLSSFAPPGGDGLIGLLYVLEGSTLGARILAKRAEKLGYREDCGARHLFSQARNLSNWSAFSERMERVCAYDQQAAVSWANATFDYARQAFESSLDAACPAGRPDQL